eukprot:2126577-Rhodomonas_salina.1
MVIPGYRDPGTCNDTATAILLPIVLVILIATLLLLVVLLVVLVLVRSQANPRAGMVCILRYPDMHTQVPKNPARMAGNSNRATRYPVPEYTCARAAYGYPVPW